MIKFKDILLKENFIDNQLNKVFGSYANRNLIMSPDDKEFVNFLTDLEAILGQDEAADFMATKEADDLALKYSIDFKEPEDTMVNINPDKVPTRMPDIGGEQGPGGVNEMARMKKLAGIREEEEEDDDYADGIVDDDQAPVIDAKVFDPGLVFDNEEDRNGVLSMLRGFQKPHCEPKDATSIIFPMDKNASLGIENEKLHGLVDALSEKISKKYPQVYLETTKYTQENEGF